MNCGSLEPKDKLNLQKYKFKPDYNTEDDDIVADFYSPCFSVSTNYDRAVGYFRASIYKELGEELLDFSIRGGKTRIICSPDIPEDDEQAARLGYESRGTRGKDEIEGSLIKSIELMASNPLERDCLDMLSLLIENGSLELFIALRPTGIYHRKIGLFMDGNNNHIAFSGSANETSSAVGTIEGWVNDETFDVYRSWGDDYEKNKVNRLSGYFQQLFSGGTKNTRVRPINEIEKETIKKYRSSNSLQSCRKGAMERSRGFESSKNIARSNISLIRGITPYYYQKQAIDAWKKAGYKGIMAMATGTGKTITSLLAIEELLIAGKIVLIVVPSTILLEQWRTTIRTHYPTVPLLLAGGEHNWKLESTKKMFISKISTPRIILATMDTASSKDFIEFFKQADNPAIVVDEAHRLGSPNRRQLMELKFNERLGLSATPERLFDPDGSSALDAFFGKSPVFSLPMGGKVLLSKDDNHEYPVLGQFLSKYNYNFVIAYLTPDEQDKWDKLTQQIRRLYAKSKQTTISSNSEENDKIKFLLIKRSNIVKGAQNKIRIASDIVRKNYPSNGKWLIYCQDENQLNQVYNQLKEIDPHRTVLMYHSKMDDDLRKTSLGYFEYNPGIIVSIKCLDEGVDVPAADGAVILASSTNPREYIQRRGRVLRKSKGKKIAEIFDVLVLPNSSEDEKNFPVSIVKNELARAYEFASLSENREVMHKLWKICFEFGVNLEDDTVVAEEEE